jgi:hypothetical protein
VIKYKYLYAQVKRELSYPGALFETRLDKADPYLIVGVTRSAAGPDDQL